MFGLADGYQLVGEVMAHQSDDGIPLLLESGSQHQSISPASAGNDRASLKHRVPMLGDGNTAISTAQETMILFWLDWKVFGPPARGHFFEVVCLLLISH
jgi:hypothetical protein